ncbi:GtrA family protein [Telmatospirillum siberiense]|uniref:GtrA/DPMS transmembrane domain-containing protein n=1 Tax=Telmatospirillum siberiense TaxID=382514 RepID=A0A2N3PXU9_9PROT|nr:GtrA family protein [Telmatospirillum siberiense]PKU25228.1 hypothetical protein CWS72_06355 [Telmatospirillum siberiense]
MFMRYIVVSALCLGVDYGLYVVLIRLFGVTPVLATAAGYLTGLVVNYLLATRYVFTVGLLSHNRLGEFAAYAATGIVGTAVSVGVVSGCERMGVNNIHVAKVLAVGISFATVYALRRYVLFQRGTPQRDNACAQLR